MEPSGTETNTVGLIGNWSMAGAHGELDGHFTSPVDIHALVAELHEETDEISQPAPLLLKPAGEDDWQPLVVASTRAA